LAGEVILEADRLFKGEGLEGFEACIDLETVQRPSGGID
jgi:hypothetical protein